MRVGVGLRIEIRVGTVPTFVCQVVLPEEENNVQLLSSKGINLLLPIREVSNSRTEPTVANFPQ